MAEPAGIYRIQKHSGLKGGSNYYHHADVKASNWETALKAAKDGRVMNWLKKLLDRIPRPGEAKALPIGTISARVFRAATGEWEDLGVIALAKKEVI